MPAKPPDEKYEALFKEIWESKAKGRLAPPLKPTVPRLTLGEPYILQEMKKRLSPEDLLEFCRWGLRAQARNFARHERFVPIIQDTDYCSLSDAKELSRYIVQVPQTPLLPPRKLSDESSLFSSSSLSTSSSSSPSSLPSLANHSSKVQVSGSIPASLARVASGVFYLLGQMAIRSKNSDRAQLLDYHFLVSLDDFSARFISEDGCPEDEWGFKEPFSPFEPDDDPDWARLSGYQPRVLMARVAESVRSWEFSGVELAVSEIWSDDLVVPATSGAIIKSLRAYAFEAAVKRYTNFLVEILENDPSFTLTESQLEVNKLRFLLPLFTEILETAQQHLPIADQPSSEQVFAYINALEGTLAGINLVQKHPLGWISTSATSALMAAIIAHRVLEIMPGSSPIEAMNAIAQRLRETKRLHSRVRNSGVPSTIAIFLGSKWRPHYYITSSKEHWPKGSYLQKLSIEARNEEMAGRMEDVATIISQFNAKVTGNRDAKTQFPAASFSEPVIPMPEHMVQAFNGDTFAF
ncbi:MAG: hypothetical protein M1829_003012 [Trizodia sp. TS-e1964]|nr:MAG: hypothetical protein M1829_003012 [Trizodia sp. TS-e1964]